MGRKGTIVRKEGRRLEFWMGECFVGSVEEEPRMKWMINYWVIGGIRIEKLKAWIKVVRERQKGE